MNILPLGKHLDFLVASIEGDLIQGQQTHQVLGALREGGIGKDTDGACLFMCCGQLVSVVGEGADGLGQLALESGAYWWSRRGVNLGEGYDT